MAKAAGEGASSPALTASSSKSVEEDGQREQQGAEKVIWLFSTNDRLRSAKYESNYLENPFPEIKGVNLLSKTHRNEKSNLRPMTVLQE